MTLAWQHPHPDRASRLEMPPAQTTMRAKQFFGIAALVVFNLAFSHSAAAHHLQDPLEAAPVAPAAGAPVERLTGEVHRLTIDDRVVGARIEFHSLQLEDGR